MRDGVQGLTKKGVPELIPSIEGVIDAFYKEEDRYRFVGKTNGDINISVDIDGGEMLVDISGLTIQVKGEHAEAGDNRFTVYDSRDGIYAEFDIEPGSRFKLKFGLKR